MSFKSYMEELRREARAELAARAAAAELEPDIKIVKITGNERAEQTIKKFEKKGYELQSLDSRKQVWNPLTGFFTAQQVHTLVFKR